MPISIEYWLLSCQNASKNALSYKLTVCIVNLLPSDIVEDFEIGTRRLLTQRLLSIITEEKQIICQYVLLEYFL